MTGIDGAYEARITIGLAPAGYSCTAGTRNSPELGARRADTNTSAVARRRLLTQEGAS